MTTGNEVDIEAQLDAIELRLDQLSQQLDELRMALIGAPEGTDTTTHGGGADAK